MKKLLILAILVLEVGLIKACPAGQTLINGACDNVCQISSPSGQMCIGPSCPPRVCYQSCDNWQTKTVTACPL